ncbi:bifunctional demethylmenaquinone methyltransferase/2-methoxy-6-polyprenyl-1,4-benzoquinol methylase, partial [archaeon]|nr:bifunctional demethylmenaquinone methyltransferase/2-methoxy-6-polyprenyl-1,4-benzoquinol methylase [archaeon]
SAEQFPHGKDFKEILEMNGFTDVTIIKLNLGIVNIYEATK